MVSVYVIACMGDGESGYMRERESLFLCREYYSNRLESMKNVAGECVGDGVCVCKRESGCV